MTIITPTGYYVIIAIFIFTAIVIGCLLTMTSAIVGLYKDACDIWQENKVLSILSHLFAAILACSLAAMIGALLQTVSPLITLLLAA